MHCIVPPQPWMDIPCIQTRTITFEQEPLHLNGDLTIYMWHCPLQVTAIITSIIVIPPIRLLLLADICFHSSPATHGPLHQLIHITIIYHVCTSKTLAQSCDSGHFRDKVEGKTMKILSGDKVPLRDNKGATD